MQTQHKDHRILSTVILFVGGLCLISAVILNIATDKTPLKAQAKLQQQQEEDTQFQAEKVAAQTDLGITTDQVKPLQQTTRVVSSGIHEPEFRGTKFVQDNANKYTIELTNLGKEEIIRDLLKQRTDRQNFNYIRLSQENQSDRYLLIYGLYSTQKEAENALYQLHLNLPVSLKPQVQLIKTYVEHVNDLGSDELTTKNSTYDVTLRPAPVPHRPVVVEQPQIANQPTNIDNASPVPAQNQAVTKTTVIQKDSKGNVVNVQRSQSKIENTQ